MSDAKPIEDILNFCPKCGQPNPAVGKIPFRCAGCDFTSYFGPVAAVGALIVKDQDQLLLVRRARDPGKGCWGLPGGFVDRDESVEDALAREIVEETGLVMTSCNLILTGPNQYHFRGTVAPVIDLFYVCEVSDQDSVSLALDELEHFEWAWPTDQHLGNMAFESNRIAIQHWMKSV